MIHWAFNNRTKTQSKLLNFFFFSFYLTFFLFFTNWMKLQKRLLPPANCLYHGWVFIYFSKYRYKCEWEFLNGEFDWEFNNFYKFSNRIKKYFFRRNVNYITYDYPYPNMAGYWKRHLLRHHVYLYFHGICTYNYK